MSKPVGPYSPVMSVDTTGNFVFTSGQIGIVDGALVDGGLEPQLRQVFRNLRTVLTDAGVGLDNVFKTTIFLTDIDDYGVMNEIYLEEFGDHRPARSAVAVAALPLGAVVEIEAIATTSDL